MLSFFLSVIVCFPTSFMCFFPPLHPGIFRREIKPYSVYSVSDTLRRPLLQLARLVINSYWPVPLCWWDSHRMWDFDFVQMMEKDFTVSSSLVQGWLLKDQWGKGAGTHCCLYCTACLEAVDNFGMPHTPIVCGPKSVIW